MGQKNILALKKIWGLKKILGSGNFFGPVIVDFGDVLLVVLILPVTWLIRTPEPLNSAKSPGLVYMSNFSLLALPLLIDFGGGFLLLLFFL